jgi:hypothetical protein
MKKYILFAILGLSLIPKPSKIIAKTSAMPIPMCAPDDPNACGMCGSHCNDGGK